MPVLGYDMVVKCQVCLDTARIRVVNGPEALAVQTNPFRMMAELYDQGFELNESGEYLCHKHKKVPVGPPGLRLVPE